MSKLERPLIEKYWNQIGGTIIFEFPMIHKSATCGPRYLDALIFPKKKRKILKPSEATIAGQDIILVQAKCSRLGMYLMGQAVFSIELMRRFKPISINSVILCTEDDSVLRPFLSRYPEIKVVVFPEFKIKRRRK
jgi:hypothetical protein